LLKDQADINSRIAQANETLLNAQILWESKIAELEAIKSDLEKTLHDEELNLLTTKQVVSDKRNPSLDSDKSVGTEIPNTISPALGDKVSHGHMDITKILPEVIDLHVKTAHSTLEKLADATRKMILENKNFILALLSWSYSRDVCIKETLTNTEPCT
jgi:hypothetical protein